MKRPKYVKCVRTGMYDKDKKPVQETWCGRTVDQFEFCFTDAAHASLSGLHKAYLVACPQCVEKITEALKNGSPE